jgi:hypothetical protein
VPLEVRVEDIVALARLQGVELPRERAEALAQRYPEYRRALEALTAEGFGQSEPALTFDPHGSPPSPLN